MKNNLRQPGLVYPSQATLALPHPTTLLRRLRPMPYRTVAAATTREQRRALRAAEQAAWEATSPSTELRARTAPAVQDSPFEKALFATLVAVAAAGVLWGLLDMFNLIERWPEIAAAIGKILN